MIKLLLFLFVFMNVPLAGAEDFAALLATAQQHLDHGQYFLAIDDLDAAQKAVDGAAGQAKIDGMRGETRYLMHQLAPAEVFLNQAIAAESGDKHELAHWRLLLAQLQLDREQQDAARQLYTQAQQLGETDPEIEIASRLGLATLLPERRRLAELQALSQRLTIIKEPAARAPYALNLAQQAGKLGPGGLQLAYAGYEQARLWAGDQHPRLLAESLDGLAQLYEAQQRLTEAQTLNSKALDIALRLEAHDLLINLAWRQGRLYHLQQQNEAAIAAYQLAVEQIEMIRQDIPVEYHKGRSSFRETLEPVYLGLADLLLAKAAPLSAQEKAPLLRRARDTVELIKQSELEDFLGGRCAVQSNINLALDGIETTTMVLYPIILADRLELLAGSGGEIRQFTQAVPATSLQRVIHRFAVALRNANPEVNIAGKQLYDWLIRPVEPWLRARQTKTLVMVPDGALRTIPPAALYDGERYLVENYALATSPGLSIFAPKAMQSQGVKALLAGLSEPGPVVDHLPPAVWQTAEHFENLQPGAPNRGVSGKTRHLNTDGGSAADAAQGPEHDPEVRKKLQQMLKLPGVDAEIAQLQAAIPHTTLLNADFTKENFKQQLLTESYSVVHIASHGVFGDSVENSFLMTFDNVINMNELEDLLKGGKFAKQPVELLTLSACETAEGDDRAPLGLSGVVLKAKVRSALGSLWPVSDEAASLLMAEFYKALPQAGVNKVEALRQAQIALLKQKNLANPYFWSPFILVGNWL